MDQMDTLGILIQAILSLKDVTKSKQQILSELPKLQQQLQSDQKARIKIIAGLDIKRSTTLIQSQLNQLAHQIRMPNISANVHTNTSQSLQNTSNIQTSTVRTQNEEQRQLNKYLAQQISLTKEILVLKTQIAKINTAKDQSRLAELQRIVSLKESELNTLQQQNTAMSNLMSVEEQQSRIIAATARERQNLDIAEQQSIDISRRSLEMAKRKAEVLKSQIVSYETVNSKAANLYKAEFDNIKNSLLSANTPEEVDRLRAKFAALKSEIKVAGKEGKTFWQKMKDGAQKFSTWFSISSIIMYIVNDIRKMVATVFELDTALVDLQKTFKGTASDLKGFYYEANDIAKQLGVTTAEVINSASSWSRLGYNTKEAATQMAKAVSMMKMISPNMNIDTANEGLISIVKAYDEIDIDNIVDEVLSPINKVGNEFAVSNSDILDGLQHSAAAMKAMGTDLYDTIALFTAGNEILQDSSQMGNALRSISLRIRGYDEETEQLSEDLVDITGKVIDLTKTASNGNKGISLFTDSTQTEYKDVVDYLGEIAGIMDEIGAKEKQELLEKLFGKNRANAGAALLSNYDQVYNVLEAIENSAGSAEKEMEVMMDSVSYKVNQFKETFTGLSQDTMTQDFLKSMIDSGIRLLETFSDASPVLQTFLNIISGSVSGITAFVKQIGLIPTVFAALSLKNVGELNTTNTPSYAPLPYCA